MPPKKKKGSGKGKKGKGKGKGAKQVPPNQVAKLDEETKEFFLVQVRDLENRLQRYQKKCDELEVANGEFQDKYVQMATDKKEIVAFWKKQVEQKADEIADLNDRHIGLQQTRDNESEAFKKQIQEQRTEYQEMKDQLTSENMILGGKLAALEEFKVQKEDLMAKFAMMEEELTKKDADHKEHLYTLEKKAVMDKDRLKKEMILRVNQVAAEFRKVSNKQMAETTKRTIRENVSINAQLAKMSDKTIELIQENDELKEKERKMKQQIELLEVNEKELAKKNHSNLKVIKMLTEKCRNQEAMIAEYEMREQEYQELEAETDILKQQVSSMREEIMGLAKDNELLEENNQGLSESCQKETQTRAEIEKIFAQAAEAIRQSLTSTTPDDESMDEEQKVSKMQRRDKMLENLLVILNKSATMDIGPMPGNMGKQWEEGSPITPTKKSSVRWDMPPPTSLLGRSGGALPHYSLGDLGLIPRPEQHITTSFDKMKLSSTSNKLGSLRGVLQKSVSTQTVSTPKALFYADQLIGKIPEQPVLRDLNSREMKCPPSGSAPRPIPKKLVASVN